MHTGDKGGSSSVSISKTWGALFCLKEGRKLVQPYEIDGVEIQAQIARLELVEKAVNV
jgi:hypothetical protein